MIQQTIYFHTFFVDLPFSLSKIYTNYQTEVIPIHKIENKYKACMQSKIKKKALREMDKENLPPYSKNYGVQ